MKTIEELAQTPNLTEAQIYDDIIYQLNEAKENGKPIEEGLFTAMFAGAAAATVGPTVMKTLCKVLGVDTKGTFGTLLTSKLVLSAMGATLGWKA